MELFIGGHYTYKEHVYEITNFGKMKGAFGWVSAVSYKRVLEKGEKPTEEVDTTTVYTRIKSDFEELFTPRHIYDNMEVCAVVMGRIVGEYIAKKNPLSYTPDKNFMVTYFRKTSDGNTEPCNLMTSDVIDFNGSVKAINHDKNLKHIDCVEYYIITPNLKKIISNQVTIHDIKTRLLSIIEAYEKLDLRKINNSMLQDRLQYIEELYPNILTFDYHE